MSWINIAGMGLEYSGKILQSASFEAWVEHQGKEIIERIAQDKTIAWFNRRRAARNVLWDDLTRVTQHLELHESLRRLARSYTATIAAVANVFEGNEYTASGKAYLIPRFIVNSLQHEMLKRELSSSDEFQKLKGGRELQGYFYDEFVDQLDAAVSQMNPSPKYAVRLGKTHWYVVGKRDGYNWGIKKTENRGGRTRKTPLPLTADSKDEGKDKEPKWQGHLFVLGSISDLSGTKIKSGKIIGRPWNEVVTDHIRLINDQLGVLPAPQKQRFAAAWIRMTDSLIAGRKVNDVPTLIA